MWKIVLCTLLLCSCSSFYYHPSKNIFATPKQFKKDFKENIISTPTGVQLSSWTIYGKNDQKKNLIVQFHGNAENMSSHMLSLLWITDYNYDLITFDYRGYGKNEGSPSPLGLREDALTFLKYVENEFEKGNYQKLIVVGQSLGGAVLLDALRFYPTKDKIHLLVLDSTFSSYRRMAMKVLQKSWITYLFSPLGYLVASGETSPQGYISEFKMPKLVIHSKGDFIVDYSEGEAIYEELISPKNMWSFGQKSHIGVFFVENNKYRQEFLKYIKSL